MRVKAVASNGDFQMIDQDTIHAEEKQLIEFLESFEDITITADVARDFFEQAEDVDTDLFNNIKETFSEMIDASCIINAQRCKCAGTRAQLLSIELDIPMITVVREKVKNALYELRIYDEE